MTPTRVAPPPASGGDALWRAIRYLRRYRLESAGALASLLLVSAANLAAPQMIRLAIDGGIAARSWPTVLTAVLGLVGIAALRGLFNFLQGYLAERASQGVAFDLREGLFAHIQRLSFSYYDQAQTGQLLTRLTNDVEQVRTFVGSGVLQFAASLAMLLGCAVLLFSMNGILGRRGRSRPSSRSSSLLRVLHPPRGPALRPGAGDAVAPEHRAPGGPAGVRVVRSFSGEAREAARYGRSQRRAARPQPQASSAPSPATSRS